MGRPARVGHPLIVQIPETKNGGNQMRQSNAFSVNDSIRQENLPMYETKKETNMLFAQKIKKNQDFASNA